MKSMQLEEKLLALGETKLGLHYLFIKAMSYTQYVKLLEKEIERRKKWKYL